MIETTKKCDSYNDSSEEKNLLKLSARDLFDMLQRQSEWSSKKRIIELALEEKKELLSALNHNNRVYSSEIVDNIIDSNLPLKGNLERLWVSDLKLSLKSLLLDMTNMALTLDDNTEKDKKYWYMIWVFAALNINVYSSYDKKYIFVLNEELSQEQNLPESPLDGLVNLQYDKKPENSEWNFVDNEVNSENENKETVRKYNIWDDFVPSIWNENLFSKFPNRYYRKVLDLYSEWERFTVVKPTYSNTFFTTDGWEVRADFVDIKSDKWVVYKVLSI